MLDYKVIKDDTQAVLYRIRKNGSMSEVLKIYTAKDKRLLQIDTQKLSTYKLKSDDIKLVTSTSTQSLYILNSTVKVYKAPHHATYSNELLRVNRLRFYLGGRLQGDCSNIKSIDYIMIDDKRLADDMLEYIIEL